MFIKKLITTVLLVSSIVLCSNLYAQDKKAILEHHWSGGSIMPADFTNSGNVILKHEMDLRVYSYSSISGNIRTTFTIDGSNYVCVCAVSGSFNSSTNIFTYKSGKRSREDKLPYGLQWCNGWGELELGRDKNSNGYYILQGTEQDDCGGTSYVEFSDK